MNETNKRRRTLLWVAVVALIAAVLLYWWFSRGRDKKPEGERPRGGAAGPARDPQAEAEQAIAKAAAAAPDERTRRKVLAAAPRLLRAYDMAQGTILPIEFFGRIVDQNGRGVPGATIIFMAGGGLGGGGKGYGEVKTDASGLFHVSSKGYSLDIQAMTCEGYEIAVTAQQRLFDGFKRFPQSVVWTDYTASKPFIYKAWKKPDGVADVQMVYTRSHTRLAVDGTPFSLNVLGEGQKFIEGKRAGQLAFEFSWDPNKADPKGWLLKMVATDGGGFVPVADELMNEAPESGYEASVEIGPDAYDYAARGAMTKPRHYYLFTGGTKRYGRISVAAAVADLALGGKIRDGGVSVEFMYFVNPTGQRHIGPYPGGF